MSIFVRRAGPNYQEGLRVMREVGASLSIPIHVFGPETHMTAIVGMALGNLTLILSRLDAPIPIVSVLSLCRKTTHCTSRAGRIDNS